MRMSSFAVVSLLSIAASACGPDNGLGFYALGSVRGTITDATGTPTTTGFDFQQMSRIDPTLPAGSSAGFTGTCQIGPNGRSVHIQQVGAADTHGLTEIAVNLPAWEQDTCTNCQHGTVTATVGGAAFTGAENRGTSGQSACTFTADRRGSYGMQLAISCSGLTATSDPRTVAIESNLTLDGCDGPSTNGM